MTPSHSIFAPIRGLQIHCRCWGDPAHPLLFMLHGWMDVSASFQFLVDELAGAWRVVAPDWRGFGLSDWGSAGSYWFPDYLADLDALLAHFSPDSPATVIGHSMGGNVACLYAGARPERIGVLVNLEGFGLVASDPQTAPRRYEKWLHALSRDHRFRDYASFEDLAARMIALNPRLTRDRAAFLAGHWGEARANGQVRLRSDPRHKIVNPVLYRLEEAEACWKSVAAPVLWVEGAYTDTPRRLNLDEAVLAARRNCFSRLTYRRIADAGHMLHHDQPAALAVAIEEFLRD
ncbi:MAG: alpha/beta hydrolase [Gammaproteobacteria bacterium]|nr:alpha/beta hydrolase [Gammaproteobacteria bacterium]